MSDTIFAVLVLGPGVLILGRWMYTGKSPSQDQLIGTLVWTFIMLLIHWRDLHTLQRDHMKACLQLERRLILETPDEMADAPEGVSAWDACYRYTDRYTEGADALEGN